MSWWAIGQRATEHFDSVWGPTGLALDAAHRRLFSTCGGKLIVLNADTGAIVAALPIGA